MKRWTWILVVDVAAAGAVLAAGGQPAETPDINVSRLMMSLTRWELWGYVSAIVVAIGVIGESIHEFSQWFLQYPWWKAKGGKASALLLILALLAEVVIQVKANSLSGHIIAFLSNQTAEATLNAAKLGVTLAQEQVKAAIAERELLQLKQSLKDRVISHEQEERLRKLLAGDPSGAVQIWWIASDKDSYPLAKKIRVFRFKCG